MILDRSLDFILNKIHANREFTDSYISAEQQDVFFNVITNRKSNGSLRKIYEPKTEEHLNIYKALYEEIKPYQTQLHDVAHGFRKGYSNATNAAKHLGAKHLLNIDIEDFFSQVSKDDTTGVFRKLGASDEVANYLAELCTVKGVLPQGLNTSPDIANHYLYEMDVELAKYCSTRFITYTRYVDDMSFSSDRQIESSEICDIIGSHDLPIAGSKRKYQKRGSNQYVTGLTIFDTERPRVPKKYKHRLRLELHVIGKVGINNFIIRQHELPEMPLDRDERKEWLNVLNTWADSKLAQIRGRIDYINGVEPDLATKMYRQFEYIVEERRAANTALKEIVHNSHSVTIDKFLAGT